MDGGVSLQLPCDDAVDATLSASENEARQAFACTGVLLQGRLVSAAGAPLAGARVTLGETSLPVDAEGRFLVVAPRRNEVIRFEAEGHRPEVRALALRLPLSHTGLDLGTVRLGPAEADTVRMLFAGDFSLGRRFLDPDESTPRDELPPRDPTALVDVADPAAGSWEAVRLIAPYFAAADFRVVNLETPVTDDPSTPHTTKDYAFFTLPGSLDALRRLGVQYLSLGNNHVYDYLERGLRDTLRHVGQAGFGFSGAGATPDEAFRPWHTALGGHEYSFLSATSISGSEHPVSYVAEGDKGGAADLRDDARLRSQLRADVSAGRIPIALLHMGIEYSEGPQSYSLSRIDSAIASGAKLVIAHHPHVAQGIGWHDGVLAAHSLGNFVFDQDRLETMLGALLQVELRGDQVLFAVAIPTYLEDYRPRPVTGDLAEMLVRRMAEASRGHRGHLALENGRGLVQRQQSTDEVMREQAVTVEVGSGGWAVVDLRALRRPGESVASAEVTNATLRGGTDVLYHGDFEDHDVDDQQGELSRWDLPESSSFLCLDQPRRGVSALCSRRSAGSRSPSFVAFRNRVRVPGDATNTPNKRLTLLAYARAENAGASSLDVTYYASEGDAEFGSVTALTTSGTHGWKALAGDLKLPADPASPDAWNAARALRIFIRQQPPPGGEGLLAVDDLAVIAWDSRAQTALSFETPNPRDFLRVEGAAGRYDVRVRFAHDR